jgi:hypothetical protein
MACYPSDQNQDTLGKSAVRIDGSRTWSTLEHRLPLMANNWENGEQLEKPLANGDTAVLLFNRLNTTMDITLDFEDVGCVMTHRFFLHLAVKWKFRCASLARISGCRRRDTSKRCWNVRDLWAGRDLGRQNGTFVAQAVPPHGCRFLRLSAGAVCRLEPPPPPPAAPHPPCPLGYKPHASGYWANTDPCNGTFVGCKEDHKDSTLEECTAKCNAAADCVAFDLFLGVPGSGPGSKACYIFKKTMQEPFKEASACLTCVKGR